MHLKIQEFDDWKVKGLWIVSIISQQNGNGNPAHRYEYTCKESNTRKRYIARKVISILLLDIILKNIIMSHVRMVRSTSGADTSKMFLIITCRMFL